MVLRLKRQRVGRLLIFYTYGRGLSFFFKVGNIEKAKPIEIFGIIIGLTTMQQWTGVRTRVDFLKLGTWW